MNAPTHIASAEAAEAAVTAEGKRAERKERAASAFRQLFGFLLAFVFVLVVLGAWSATQDLEQSHPRARLYGELLFLGLVVWWGLVTISPWLSRATRSIHKAVEVPPISNVQALVWAGVIIVAVPIAIQHEIIGFAIPIVVSTACATGLVLARRRWEAVPRAPLCLSCVVGLLALIPLAMWTDMRGPAAPEPAGESVLVPDGDALATRLRPLLFFDDDELYPPVDVARAKKEGCEITALGADCEPVASVAPLEKSEWDYLKVKAPPKAGDRTAPTSPIFHHVFEEEARDGKRIYVDYWWYFAHNPVPMARSVLCGRALTRGLLGKACAEHPADWEGITLMLAPCRETSSDHSCIRQGKARYEIREVHYAQHEKVIRYQWTTLQQLWSQEDMAEWAKGAGHRPLVFVARSSHASYAMPCASGNILDRLVDSQKVVECPQLVHPEFGERRNGELAWAHNEKCRDNCVMKLPTDGKTGEPTGWNAFQGRWGPQTCILFGTYCDAQPAPLAPAYQDRYKDPCPSDGEHCLLGGNRF